jgi:hypothetical protein
VILKKYGSKEIVICVGDMSRRDAGPGQAPMPRLIELLRTLKNMKYTTTEKQIVSSTTSKKKKKKFKRERKSKRLIEQLNVYLYIHTVVVSNLNAYFSFVNVDIEAYTTDEYLSTKSCLRCRNPKARNINFSFMEKHPDPKKEAIRAAMRKENQSVPPLSVHVSFTITPMSVLN